jgi:hypothetical protein
MRALFLSLAFGLAASAAAAQPAVLVESKPIQGTVPDVTREFPAKVLRWIDEETERQFQTPTSMFDLELGMLKALEPELHRVAKKQNLSFDEASVLIMQQVIVGSAKKMDRAVHARREVVEKAGTPDRQDPELRSLGVRKANLLTLITELGPRMTHNTRLLSQTTASTDLANMGAMGK